MNFTVAVDPFQSPGVYTGSVTIPSDDADEPSFTVNLSAEITDIPSDPIYFLSSNSNGSLTNPDSSTLAFRDEDIVRYDTGTGIWSMFFDGSDVGAGANDLDAFHVTETDATYLSFEAPVTLPGIGTVDDSDIVLFTPTSTGDNTAGTFALFFDASDVGLTLASEDVDAISFTPEGDLVISVNGTYAVPSATGTISGGDEDLLLFSSTGFGDTTTGTFELHFNGSDLAMTTNNEDVNAVSIDELSGEILFSTIGNLRTPSRNGNNDDVFSFNGTTGENTAGPIGLLFDGATIGFGGENIDGLTIRQPASEEFVIEAALATFASDDTDADEDLVDAVFEDAGEWLV